MSRKITLQDNKLWLSTTKSHPNLCSHRTILNYRMCERPKIELQKRLGVKTTIFVSEWVLNRGENINQLRKVTVPKWMTRYVKQSNRSKAKRDLTYKTDKCLNFASSSNWLDLGACEAPPIHWAPKPEFDLELLNPKPYALNTDYPHTGNTVFVLRFCFGFGFGCCLFGACLCAIFVGMWMICVVFL